VQVHPDEPPDLVTRAHIARRLHLSRAALERARSSPGFPAPVGRLGASTIWRWADVRRWAEAAAGQPGGPTEDGMRLAGIRDRFRAAGFRLKIAPRGDGGWRAIRVPIGRPSAAGEAFEGRSALEAAERALSWLESHR
jgi:hypothetical protein